MMKKKILIGVLLAAVASGVAYCSTTESGIGESPGINIGGIKIGATDNSDLHHINWIKAYPQLANIESNNQTAVIDKLRTSESISALIGPINNPYGVRDDILDAIVKSVPEDNPKLLQAAIADAYSQTLAYYSPSNEDKLKYTRKNTLVMNCMYIYARGENDNIAHKLIKASGDKFRDTNARSSYIGNLEQTVFAWQMLGSGYSGDVEDKMCKTGEYLK